MKTLLVLMFCLAAPLAPLFAQDANPKKLLREAKRLVKDGNFRGALPLLEDAYAVDQEEPELLYYYGKTLVEADRAGEAEAPLAKLYLLEPQFEEDLAFYYGAALHGAMRFDRAAEILKRAREGLSPLDSRFSAINRLLFQGKYAKTLVGSPIEVKVENLGPGVNTEYEEYAPVVNADETMLLFASIRPGNIGGQQMADKYYEDVYISEKDSVGQWTKAENLGAPVNTEGYDAPISVSPDGQKLFLHRDDNGGDLYSARLDGAEWAEPENLGQPVNSPFWEPSVWESADGRALFYSSNRPGGRGNLDLYVSFKLEDGSWSKGANLGPDVNTPGHEDAPYLHPDGRTLYFASNGHKTMGGFDIFKTVYQPNGRWSKPENLGYPINTVSNDNYFVMTASGRHAYYASSAGEDHQGGKDIYRITFPLEPDTAEQIFAFQPAQQISVLKGVVTDAETRLPVEAAMFIVDNDADDTLATMNSNRVTGKYLATLPPGRNYAVVADAEGYLFCSENVRIPKTQKEYLEVIKDLELQPIKKGNKIRLNNVFFDFDKATLRPESKAELGRLYEIMAANPSLKIRINGHTDAKGSDTYNRNLSERRAKAVADHLIKLGIAPGRADYKGFGESQPVATNETDEGRQLNRRTEFEVMEE